MLQPPVSLTLATSSYFRLRLFVILFSIGGLLAWLPYLIADTYSKPSRFYLALPVSYISLVLLWCLCLYPPYSRDPRAQGILRKQSCNIKQHNMQSTSSIPLFDRVSSYYNTVSLFGAWLFDLQDEVFHGHIPSWTALFLIGGYVHVLWCQCVAWVALDAAPFKTCGGYEPVCGGVPAVWLNPAGENATQGLQYFMGYPVVWNEYAGGPLLWYVFHEQVAAARPANLQFICYFIACIILSVSMAWQQQNGTDKLLTRKFKEQIKQQTMTANSGTDLSPSSPHSSRAPVSPSSASTVNNDVDSTKLNIESEWRRAFRELVTDRCLYGCLYLMNVRASDCLESIYDLLKDEEVSKKLQSSLLRVKEIREKHTIVQTGLSDYAEAFSSFLKRDPFALQYIIVLEVIGQMRATAGLWGVKMLDKKSCSDLHWNSLIQLKVYSQPTSTSTSSWSVSRVLRVVQSVLSCGRLVHTGTESDGNQVVDTENPRPASNKVAQQHVAADVSSNSSHPTPTSVDMPPPLPSHWRLFSLLIGMIVAGWLPVDLLVWYTEDFTGLVITVLVLSIPFVCICVCLVGKVLQFPFCCYEENYLCMLALYHTKLKLERKTQLRGWRDLRNYFVHYRMSILFILAQWPLVSTLLTWVIGLLFLTIIVVVYGFSALSGFANQAVSLLVLATLIFSFTMVSAAVRVWEQQQLHVRLLQDRKFNVKMANSRDKTLLEIKRQVKDSKSSEKLPELQQQLDGRERLLAAKYQPILDSMNELQQYILEHDEAPKAFGIALKPTLFRTMQGYIVSAVLAWAAKYGTTKS